MMNKGGFPEKYITDAVQITVRLIDGEYSENELSDFQYFFNKVVSLNKRLFFISRFSKKQRIREKARKRILRMTILRLAWYLWYTSIDPAEV